MASVQYNWQIYCVDESKTISVWGETKPTVCPNNHSHTINHELTDKVHRVEPRTIKIAEENVPIGAVKTNRNFAMRNHCFDVEIGVTTTYTSKTFIYPITLINVMIDVTPEMVGDDFIVDVYPDTTVGVVTTGVTTGQNEFYVNDTVIENVLNGFEINITDGVNIDRLGPCLSIDPVNKIIKTEKSTSFSFNAYSYVRFSARFLDIELPQPGLFKVAMNTIGGQYIPADTRIEGCYCRSDVTKKERVRLYYEFYY